MNPLSKIRRAILAAVPGTVANVAAEKRRIEKQLRADGWSRRAACAEAAKRCKSHA